MNTLLEESIESNAMKVRAYCSHEGKYEEQPYIVAFGELKGPHIPFTELFSSFPRYFPGNIETYMDTLKFELTCMRLLKQKAFIYPERFHDFQSLLFKNSYFIESLLKQNPTTEELYRLLRNSVDVIREQSLIKNITVDKELKQRYETYDNSPSIHDIFKTKSGIIVLHSSLKSDISYKIQEKFISILGNKNPKNVDVVIEEKKDEIIKEIIEDITRIYHLIYALNPNASILEIGFSISELYKFKNNTKNMDRICTFLIDLIEQLTFCLRKEDVAYITGATIKDNSPVQKQRGICNELLSTLIEKVENPIEHHGYEKYQEEFENEGLYGMMKQEENLQAKFIEWYKKTHNRDVLKKINEHEIAMKCYQKTIRKIG